MGALDIPAPGGLDRRSLALVSDAAGQAALGERGPALGGVIVGVQVHGDVVGQRAEIVQQVQGGREEWGIMAVGRGYDATARYSLTICHAGSLQAELVPVDRGAPGGLAAPEGLGDAAIDGDLFQHEADDAVVCLQDDLSELGEDAEPDPLVAAVPDGGCRAGGVGDGLVRAAEPQNLQELVEDDSVADPLPVVSQRMSGTARGAVGQQGRELVPQRLGQP